MVNPSEAAILVLSVNSATLPYSDVDEYAETTIAQRVSMLTGVARVQVFGAAKFAVRVQVDPDAMAAHDIDDVWVLADNPGAVDFYRACGFAMSEGQATYMTARRQR